MRFGMFLGGAAKGYEAGMEETRKQEAERRREAEYQRQEGARLAASNTLGNIGTDREDGSTYGEADAYKDYSRQVAQYDPQASMNARTAALGYEEKQLGLKKAKRDDRTQDTQQQLMDVRQQAASGAITLEDAMRKLATFHGPVPDGRQAFVTNVNGQPYVVLGDERTRSSQLHPLTMETFDQAWNHMYSSTSPQAYQQERDLGMKSRQVGAAETTARAAEQNAKTNEGLRGAQATYYDRMGRAAITSADSRGSYAPAFSQAGTLDDGTPVVFDQRTGRYQNGVSGQPLSGEQLKLFQKVTGQKPPAGDLVAVGQTGLLQNRVTGDLFKMDDRTGQLVPVTTPQSLDKLGQGIMQNLGKGRQGAPGAPGASAPPPATVSGLNPGAVYEVPGAGQIPGDQLEIAKQGIVQQMRRTQDPTEIQELTTMLNNLSSARRVR